MQEGRVFRIGGADSIDTWVLFEQLMEVLRPGDGGRTSLLADEQDMIKMGQRLPDAGHLALIERFGGHQHLGLADREPGANGFRPEG